MIRSIFVFVIAVLFEIPAFSQPFGPYGGCRYADSPGKTFFNQEILPLIQAKRLEFESILTPEDRAQINAIRNEFRTLRQSHQEKVRELRQTQQKPDWETRRQLYQERQRMKELKDQIRSIAIRYEEILQPMIENLKTEISETRKEFREQNGYYPFCPGYSWQGGEKPRKDRTIKDGTYPKWLTPEWFLLMEPATEKPSGSIQPEQEIKISIFPNPASDKIQINTASENALTGFITITDINGNELLKTESITFQEGLGSYQMDISKLKNGIYFVRFNTGEKSVTQRLIIRKN